MYVYRRADTGQFEVGHYEPTNSLEYPFWIMESAWKFQETAARRVHWLNGGDGNDIFWFDESQKS